MNTNEKMIAKAAYDSCANRCYTIAVDGTAVEFKVSGTIKDVLAACRAKVHYPFEVVGDEASLERDGNYYVDGAGDSVAEFEIYLDCPSVANSSRRYAVATWSNEEV